MPKKITKRNKLRRNKRKSSKTKRRSYRKKMRKGGGCGCSKNGGELPKLFTTTNGGGYVSPATFNSQQMPIASEGGTFLPLNSYSTAGSTTVDPTEGGMSTRNDPNMSSTHGGRGKKGKRMTKKSGQKGGSFLTDVFLGPNNGNVLTSFASLNGVPDVNNLLTLNYQADARPWMQPIDKFYGQHNRAMV